jgi:hypothetical protein
MIPPLVATKVVPPKSQSLSCFCFKNGWVVDKEVCDERVCHRQQFAADVGPPVVSDEDFAACYSGERGRPSILVVVAMTRSAPGKRPLRAAAQWIGVEPSRGDAETGVD